MALVTQDAIVYHDNWMPANCRKRAFTIFTSQRAPFFLRKLRGTRVYLLVENRDPAGATVYMDYNSIPQADGSGGIELIFGMRYELYTPFAPDNEIIWFVGSLGATRQRINVTEGYQTNALFR